MPLPSELHAMSAGVDTEFITKTLSEKAMVQFDIHSDYELRCTPTAELTKKLSHNAWRIGKIVATRAEKDLNIAEASINISYRARKGSSYCILIRVVCAVDDIAYTSEGMWLVISKILKTTSFEFGSVCEVIRTLGYSKQERL